MDFGSHMTAIAKMLTAIRTNVTKNRTIASLDGILPLLPNHFWKKATREPRAIHACIFYVKLFKLSICGDMARVSFCRHVDSKHQRQVLVSSLGNACRACDEFLPASFLQARFHG
jgi:hypothetical protein